MSKVLPYLGILFLAQMVFIGMVHVLVRVQGKDSPETFDALHAMPILGGFFMPIDEPKLEPTEEELREATALKQLIESRDFFQLPPGYSREELDEVMRMAKDATTRYQQELLRLDKEQEELEQSRADIEEERQALMGMGDTLKARAEALQLGMEELEFKTNRLETEEVNNLRAVAAIYEQMPIAAASEQLLALGDDTAAKVLKQMPARKSGKILGSMPTARGVAVTQRIKALSLTPE